MKKRKVGFRVGDRIVDDFLGKGKIIEVGIVLVLVQWDKTPPMKYNMGTNPCVTFIERIWREK